MLIYRITGSSHSADLSGFGAAKFGGRWNRKGTLVLYAGENREIALLEVVVHVPQGILPELDVLTLEIPDDSIEELPARKLPPNWSKSPAPAVLADIGEKWIRNGKFIALKVPSSIISTSFIYILNCNHPEFHKVQILDRKPFRFDHRLKK